MSTTTFDTSATSASTRNHGWRSRLFTRNAWLVAGGMALTGLGLAAGLAWRPALQTELLSPGSLEATRASLASNEAVIDSGKPADKLATDAAAKEGTPVPLTDGRGQGGSAKTAGATYQKRPSSGAAATQDRASAQSQQYASSSGVTPLATQQAAVCSHCGVIEAVREVTVKGRGTGVGAVAGGVLGGAVGNQMGKGNGRTVMTILGAIGGGFAGNEVEKRARSEKAYDVRVRMEDGTVRTFRQKAAPTPGARVTVEGNVLHVTRGTGGDGQMMRTSTGV